MKTLAGILFDKDGTLFNFSASWSRWTEIVVEELADGNADKMRHMADAIGYDLTDRIFLPHSILIAGTVAQQVERLLPTLPHMSEGQLLSHLRKAAAEAEMVPAAPLPELLADLRDRNLRLGVATNDAESAARAHLERAGIADALDFVAGFDSGFGAKPDPGMCLAFAQTFDLDPATVLMVGDSLHDLNAGRAAGMVTVGVLTGGADRATLAPHADIVLASVADLPGWLDSHRT